MIEKVRHTVEREKMLTCGGAVCVALSGGADSMALLHVLRHLEPVLGITVSAFHLNHGIRGDEASRDEDFVKKICREWNVPLICENADVPSYAEQNGLSTELAARKIRYDYFEKMGCLVATAHHSDDQAETLLFRLSRGTGLSGLCGIPFKRGNIIRPLMDCSRAEIEEYCLCNKISFVTDSTNFSDEYNRNRIRHHVIPQLKAINPSFIRSVTRTADALRIDNDYLNQQTEYEYQKRQLNDGNLNVVGFSELHEAIARRILLKFCGSTLDAEHLKTLYRICLDGGKCSLANDEYAEVKNGILKKNKNDEPKKTFSVTWKKCKYKEILANQKVHNLFLKNLIDCDKIIGKLELRTRRPGDRVCFWEKQGTKTLKKLFNEQKIPQNERDVLPVLADENGVVWIFGFGVCARCRVGEKTTDVFYVEAIDNLKGEI